MTDVGRNDGWERGWSGHRDAQQRRLAALSLMEKLAWLEAAHETVVHLATQRPAATDGRHTAAGHVLPRRPEFP